MSKRKFDYVDHKEQAIVALGAGGTVQEPGEKEVVAPKYDGTPDPEFTVDKYIGGRPTPIQFAFVRGEKLQYGIRKLTMGQWAVEFQRFLTPPR